jgi:hypothetical protein
MAEPASSVAKIALLVSVGTALFSAFQWWNSRQENRINAAIEISRNYLRDRDYQVTSTLYSVGASKFDPGTLDMPRIGHHLEFLEYVALLTLTNKIDKTYLSPALICDIAQAEGALRIIGKRFETHPLESKLNPFIRDNPCQAAIVRRENSN